MPCKPSLPRSKERQTEVHRMPPADALTAHEEASGSSDEAPDSEEPDPEAVGPYAEPPRFHVVEVP